MAALAKQGCFKPLATTTPPISPVAWSSFQTGVNPGKHNVFDFLTPDPRSYQPKLASVEIRPPRRAIRLGKFQLPLGRASVRLLRKSVPFWQILGKHGIFSGVIRVPLTFPPEKFYGVQLSGMCVPDLRGTQGTFSYFTTRPDTLSTDRPAARRIAWCGKATSIAGGARRPGKPLPHRRQGVETTVHGYDQRR